MTKNKQLIIIFALVAVIVIISIIFIIFLVRENSDPEKTIAETDTADDAEITPNEPQVGASIPQPVIQAILESAEGSGFGDPYQVDFPPVEKLDETVAWFQEDGKPLITLFTQTAEFWANEEHDCNATATVLENLGTPTELLSLISAIPDKPTQDVMEAVLFGVTSLLGACTRDGSVDTDSPNNREHAWQWIVAHRRLVELGIITE